MFGRHEGFGSASKSHGRRIQTIPWCRGGWKGVSHPTRRTLAAFQCATHSRLSHSTSRTAYAGTSDAFHACFALGHCLVPHPPSCVHAFSICILGSAQPARVSSPGSGWRVHFHVCRSGNSTLSRHVGDELRQGAHRRRWRAVMYRATC